MMRSFDLRLFAQLRKRAHALGFVLVADRAQFVMQRWAGDAVFVHDNIDAVADWLE